MSVDGHARSGYRHLYRLGIADMLTETITTSITGL